MQGSVRLELVVWPAKKLASAPPSGNLFGSVAHMVELADTLL